MTRRGDVRLRWALVNGERVEAARFVDVRPDDRPVGHCPCCGERVAWKAGAEVSPHVSHLPDSTCSVVSSGESAAHFNAKFDLADKLSALQEFKADWYCRCSALRRTIVARRWSRVAIEHRSTQTTRVPDVALLDEAGAIVLAIEIVHTHAVDAAKAADYAAADIPWIEINVSDATAWQPTSTWAVKALAYGNLCTHICDHCERIERQRIEQERIEQERQRLRREHYEAQARAHSELMRQRRLRAIRYRVLQEYQTKPPSLRIAISASVSADGSDAVAAFCKVDFDGPVRVVRVSLPWVDSWTDAIKAGLAECIRHLDEKAPKKKATIMISINTDWLNNVPWYESRSEHAKVIFERSLQVVICERGHYLQFASPKRESPTYNEKVASALRRAHAAAETARLNAEAA
jgi:hypothetical protein